VVFLQDEFAGSEAHQAISSNQVIQCLDNETGEQVNVIQQGTKPVFNHADQSWVMFTTGNCSEPYEMPFITYSLKPGRKYRLCFKPTRPISHWSASADSALRSFAKEPVGSLSASDIPTPSAQTIPWEAAGGNDTIIFEARSARPNTPNVNVSLSAPSTYCLSSLSKAFAFTLTFSTHAT
jgi:hypothetical protein